MATKIAKKEAMENGVKFTFSNGTIIMATLDGIPFEMKERLAVHGLSQKLGDSYASANDKGWSVQDCADTVAEILHGLRAGIWSQAGGSGVNIMAEAIARMLDKTAEQCAEILAAMTDDERKEMAKRDDVKAMVAQIKAERAKARLAATPGAGDDVEDLQAMFTKD
jgi:hypothetical protein